MNAYIEVECRTIWRWQRRRFERDGWAIVGATSWFGLLAERCIG